MLFRQVTFFFILLCLSVSISFANPLPISAKTTQYLTWFLSSSSQGDKHSVQYVQLEIDALLSKIDGNKHIKKGGNKGIKALNKLLTKEYFQAYDQLASFDMIFKTKTYNEATASALYLFIFEHLQWSYYLSHDMNSLLPIVEDKEDKICVLSKSLVASEEDQQQFVHDYLVVLEALQEIRSIPTESSKKMILFKRHYMSSSRKISPEELAGELYFQQALKKYIQKDYEQALLYLHRTDQLYRLPRNQIIRKICLLQQAVSKDEYTPKDIEELFVLHKEHPLPATKAALFKAYYHEISLVFEEPKDMEKRAQLVKSKYLKVIEKDPLFTQNVERIFLSKAAEHYSNTDNGKQTRAYIDSLYFHWPSNKEVQELIAALLVNDIPQQQHYNKGITQIEVLKEKYPFLYNNKLIGDFHLKYLSERIRYYFENDMPQSGIDAIDEFERYLQAYGPTKKVDIWLTTTYASASYYYFSLEDYTNAKYFINKGLLLQPDNHFFQHRAELLANY